MRHLVRRAVHWLRFGTWHCRGYIVGWVGRDNRPMIGFVCYQCHQVRDAQPVPEHLYFSPR